MNGSDCIRNERSGRRGRVTLIISSLRPGGAEKVITTMANHWVEAGRDVTIITLNHGNDPPYYPLHPDIKHHRLIRSRPGRSVLRRLTDRYRRTFKRRYRTWVWVMPIRFGWMLRAVQACTAGLLRTSKWLRSYFSTVKRSLIERVKGMPFGIPLRNPAASMPVIIARKVLLRLLRVLKRLRAYAARVALLTFRRGKRFVRTVWRGIRRLRKILFRNITSLFRLLRKRLFDLEKYCWQRQFVSSPMERLLIWMFDFMPSPLRWEILLIQDLQDLIAAAKPDIVISFMTGNNVRTLRAASPLNIPVIISERTAPQRTFPRKKQLVGLKNVLYPKAYRLVVQTPAARDFYLPLMNGRVEVIPNPVQPLRITAPVPKLNRPRIVTLGRLVHEKGHDLLIEAFRIVHRENPEWILEIWGAGPLQKTLDGLIRKYRLRDHASLRGNTGDTERVLRQAEMYVMTSRFEGFSNALCEAMTCGLPCVVFDCPVGPAAIITNGVDGILVPPGDIAALAENINALIKDERRRAALGENAKQVAERFSVGRVMALWDRVLEHQPAPCAADSVPESGTRLKKAG